MAEGRASERWDHTAALMARLTNCLVGGRGRVFQAADFHPYAKRGPRGIPLTKDTIPLLKPLFPKRKKSKDRKRGG